jgi:hypothetical protein
LKTIAISLVFLSMSVGAETINLTWAEQTKRTDGTDIASVDGYVLRQTRDGIETGETLPPSTTSIEVELDPVAYQFEIAQIEGVRQSEFRTLNVNAPPLPPQTINAERTTITITVEIDP